MTVTPAMVDAAMDREYGETWRQASPDDIAISRSEIQDILTAALAVSGYGEVVEALEEVRELAVTLIDAVGDDAEQGGTAILMRAKAALSRITGDQS
jgi:hypothetical protein